MKKYITPSVRCTDIELRNMIAASGLFMSEDDADTNSDILVKQEENLFGNEVFGIGEDFGNETWGGKDEW